MCLTWPEGIENWTLPGGSLEEYDETYEDCFTREAAEEADITLKHTEPLGYVSGLYEDGKPIKNRQLFYFAMVDEIKEQTPDPATGVVTKRIFIDPEDFLTYTGWVKSGKERVDAAVKRFRELRGE